MAIRFTKSLAWVLLICAPWSIAADASPPSSSPAAGKPSISRDELLRKAKPAIERALKFQVDRQQPDGGWAGPEKTSDPAITAIVAQGLIQDPAYGPNHPVVKRAIDFILKYQQPDGGIYDPKKPFLNYSTCVSLMSLSATGSPALQPRIQACQKFLKDNQWAAPKCDNDGKPITPSHPWYGGAGYGFGRRPDLSNTGMMLEALQQSGLPADDPAYQKALKFVQRCQMLAVSNDQPFAEDATDGGFIYTPANGGHSNAGSEQLNGRSQLRSYGSMTYTGFKSMIYADVSRSDPRVKAAWDWIRRNYTLESNPNMPGRQSMEGLYYFYQVFGKALQAWGEPVVVDAKDRPHDWRADLVDQLLKRQQPDGSWVNNADRWYEGYPHLVTGYAVLSLQSALR